MIRNSFMKDETAYAWLACLCLCCLPDCGSPDRESGETSLGGGPSGTRGSVSAGGGEAKGGGTGVMASSLGGQNDLGSDSGRPIVQGGAPIGGSLGSNYQTGGSSERTQLDSASAGGVGAGGTSSGTRPRSSKTSGGADTGGSPSAGGATANRSSPGANTGGAATGGGKAIGGAATGGTTSGGKATGGSNDPTSLCPAGVSQTITVAKDGSGEYSTVQAAVDSIADNSRAPIRIDIQAGTYTEKLTIANRTNLCLVGADANTTILTYADSNSTVGSTYGSASVLVSANDFSAARLTFRNSYGAGSQAVALRTTGQRQQFLDCRLVGYQDTLYVHSGTQYFRNCYVQGNTDYVFGGATAILQDCEVRNVQSGSAVAAPNTASSTAYGIVFLGGQFTAASGVSNVALARPWGADGAAAFLNATLGGHISAAGFTVMSGNNPADARFSEYQNTGMGANASGRSSYQLTAAEAARYTIANIYAGAWTPSYSL